MGRRFYSSPQQSVCRKCLLLPPIADLLRVRSVLQVAEAPASSASCAERAERLDFIPSAMIIGIQLLLEQEYNVNLWVIANAL